MGRYLGHAAAGALASADTIARWEREVGTRTRFMHVLLFQIAAPSELLSYVLGILQYPFRKSIAVLAGQVVTSALIVTGA